MSAVFSEDRVVALEDALDRAILSLHYAAKHQSVRLGRLISTCTDDPCPRLRAALSPATPQTPWYPPAAPLDAERLARAVKALIRDFTWESENVRLVLTVGPVPYGPGPWTIGGNPDGNVALALAHEYAATEAGS